MIGRFVIVLLVLLVGVGCGVNPSTDQSKEIRDLQATVAALQRAQSQAAVTAITSQPAVTATVSQRGSPAATPPLIAPSSLPATPASSTQQQLNSAVTVTLDQKGFLQGEYQSYNTFTLSFRNNTPKDMLGVKGVATFNDLFGDKIVGVNVSYDKPISAGQVAIWDAQTDFNQFLQGDVKLRDTPQERIQFVFLPQTILFTGGSKLDINGP